MTHSRGDVVAGGTIYRIDPTSNQVAAELVPGEVPPVAGVHTPPVLAAGHGYVWTTRQTDQGIEIVRIDPQTNTVLGTGLSSYAFYPFSVAGGRVWFRAGYEDAEPGIAALEPATLRVQPLVQLDSTMIDAALDPETMTIWVADYERRITRIDLR